MVGFRDPSKESSAKRSSRDDFAPTPEMQAYDDSKESTWTISFIEDQDVTNKKRLAATIPESPNSNILTRKS